MASPVQYPRVEFFGSLAIITLGNGENRFNLNSIAGINAALDKVESNPDVKGLITTGEGKFYSNGIDLAWLGKQNGDVFRRFMINLHALSVRLLTFPMVTVAAINGHAFAAGCFFSLAHDYRIMRRGRGWMSINEVHIGLQFGDFWITYIRARINPSTIHEAAVLGKRYTAEEAQEAGLIKQVCEPQNLVRDAQTLANMVLLSAGGAYGREILGNMKKDIYKPVIDISKDEVSSFEIPKKLLDSKL